MAAGRHTARPVPAAEAARPAATLSIAEQPGAITFGILVAPRSSREQVGPLVGDRVRVAVHAAPVAGKANQAVCDALARALGLRRAQVSIIGGEHGKRKTVRLEGVTAEQLRRILA